MGLDQRLRRLEQLAAAWRGLQGEPGRPASVRALVLDHGSERKGMKGETPDPAAEERRQLARRLHRLLRGIAEDASLREWD